MKSYMLALGIISILLISACSQEAEPAPAATEPKIILPVEIPPVEKTAESTPAAAENPAPGKPGNAEGKTAAPAPSVKEFDITAKQFEFIPSIISVNQGDKVRLNVTSEDVAHGFSISEFNINENLKPGVAKTIEFTADKSGEFTFSCSVYCGTGHSSMKGKLIVK